MIKYADAWGVIASDITKDFIGLLDAALVNGKLFAIGCDVDTGLYWSYPPRTWSISGNRGWDNKPISTLQAALRHKAIRYPTDRPLFYCHLMLADRDLALFCGATNPPPPQSSLDRVRDWMPPVRVTQPAPVELPDAKLVPRSKGGRPRSDDMWRPFWIEVALWADLHALTPPDERKSQLREHLLEWREEPGDVKRPSPASIGRALDDLFAELIRKTSF